MGDAQVNAIRRMLAANDGLLPTPEEIKERGKGDPRFLAPTALFSFERSLEPPTQDEGFETVEVRRFERSRGAGGPRGLVVDLDETLADEGVAFTVRARRAGGWRVLALAWRPGTDAVGSRADAFAAARATLGDVDVGCCPHAAGPPVCWCRKPIPGHVIEFAERERIALHDIVIVGRSAADRTMAERLGATYVTSLEPTVSSG
jgi:hypothetical protein